MALTETQTLECLREIGAFIKKRRPREDIRDKLDYRGEILKSEVVLSSVRPAFDSGEPRAFPFAKIKWIGTQRAWVIYWMRADLKWHRYSPSRKIRSLADALAEIDSDPYCCFFG
jgi:hypothetical protein